MRDELRDDRCQRLQCSLKRSGRDQSTACELSCTLPSLSPLLLSTISSSSLLTLLTYLDLSTR